MAGNGGLKRGSWVGGGLGAAQHGVPAGASADTARPMPPLPGGAAGGRTPSGRADRGARPGPHPRRHPPLRGAAPAAPRAAARAPTNRPQSVRKAASLLATWHLLAPFDKAHYSAALAIW